MSIRGVPAVNYVAWVWALLPYTGCYFRVRRDNGKDEGRKAGAFLFLIPVIDDLPIEILITSCSLVLGIKLLNPLAPPCSHL
jgi:hypothetical protein